MQNSHATTIKPRIVKVAVPCPLYNTFDYKLPENFNIKNIEAGTRVRVPFGRQKLIGVIIEEISDSSFSVGKLKEVLAVLDDTSLPGSEIFKLTSWAAKYYVHPPGDALQTALPVYLRNNDDATPPLTEYWTIANAETKTGLNDEAPPEEQLKRAPKQLQVYQLLKNCEPTSPLKGLDAQQLNEITDNWRTAIKALLEKGLIKQDVRATILHSSSHTDDKAPHHALNQEQQAVVADINKHDNKHAVHLINGITGSGKTEVYLALCEPVIAAGKQVLILVPEIGLTPQLTQRFLQHLNTSIVILHSAMNDKQRYASWHAAANQQAQLLIGTRSSIFTPMPELGLIIIDEEHDGSYKQQDGFRYNARDLAIVRAKNKNIPVILGSATASLESLLNTNEQRYIQHNLTKRANKKPLPKTRLVNLCNQKLHEGMAETLLDTIKQHLQQRGQVLLFINRRGFAPLLMCHDCGWTTNCQRCDAHMTFHKRHHQLICHHCGSQRQAPETCGDCGSTNILAIGAGTERIESYLQETFPETQVSRIDRDTTRKKGSLQEKLEKARSGESGILVGTQMLAKGHDFPNITLVCILDTDQALFSADFRAAEHLAQLITQVSGRAGRAEKAGEVLIQTHHPDHPLLQNLLHKGYPAFASSALQERSDAGLPPCNHLALLRCESTDVNASVLFLKQAMALTENIDKQDIELFGPLPAPMERRAGRYRYQIMLQSKQRKTLHPFMNWWIPQLQKLPSARKVRWSLDVDPYDTF